MRKIEYWIAQKIDGKEMLLYRKKNVEAQDWVKRYADKGYYIVIKRKNK